MCGINFILKLDNKLNKTEKNIFIRNSLENEERGSHGWGLWSDRNVLYRINKTISECKRKLRYYSGKADRFILLHTRQATVQNTQNISEFHPFLTENFVLVHNGMIHNDKELKRKYKLDYTETTDSAVIVNLIQHFYNKNNNIVEAIKETCKELRGSFACVLVDKNSGDIYLFRYSNPFWLAYSKERNLIVGSSQRDHIEKAVTISKVKRVLGFFEVESNISVVNDLLFKQLEENKIYRIKYSNFKKVEELGEFEVKSYSYDYCYSNVGWGGYSSIYRGDTYLSKRKAKKLIRYLREYGVEADIIHGYTYAEVLIKFSDLRELLGNDIYTYFDNQGGYIKIETTAEAEKLKSILRNNRLSGYII